MYFFKNEIFSGVAKTRALQFLLKCRRRLRLGVECYSIRAAAPETVSRIRPVECILRDTDRPYPPYLLLLDYFNMNYCIYCNYCKQIL